MRVIFTYTFFTYTLYKFFLAIASLYHAILRKILRIARCKLATGEGKKTFFYLTLSSTMVVNVDITKRWFLSTLEWFLKNHMEDRSNDAENSALPSHK